eukprot:m.98791 g.98791  ORF g.98791 m.98791 type:complete len:577 (-) comp8870_c0_seq1:310-2040(-)
MGRRGATETGPYQQAGGTSGGRQQTGRRASAASRGTISASLRGGSPPRRSSARQKEAAAAAASAAQPASRRSAASAMAADEPRFRHAENIMFEQDAHPRPPSPGTQAVPNPHRIGHHRSPNNESDSSGYGFEMQLYPREPALAASAQACHNIAVSSTTPAMLPLIEPLPVFGSPPSSPFVANKKRKTSHPAAPASASAQWSESHGSGDDDVSPIWSLNENETFCRIFDQRMGEIPPPAFRVQVDKGFKRCSTGDGFICQKKNHFQITVSLQLMAQPSYVSTSAGVLRVSDLYIVMHGIKMEAPQERVALEQSQSDRSRRLFKPVAVKVSGNEMCRVTIGRLHFSEPTANNMRKKGKANPDQRYFGLVVSLAAKAGDEYFTIASHLSEKIIVRASNPRQFESDPSPSPARAMWSRGAIENSVYHLGTVGINVEAPEEALCIAGNIRLTGAILQPSDVRLKRNIRPLDSTTHYDRFRRLQLFEYNFTDDWSEGNQSQTHSEVGVLAQQVASVFPDAVISSGDASFNDGSVVDGVLTVNKDRLLMESLNAVQVLGTAVENLTRKVQMLEHRLPASDMTL